MNFAWCTYKSPPLLRLVNTVWSLTGVHVWVARRLALAIGLCAGLLTATADAGAVMFDLPLTLCVLGVLDALLEINAMRWRRVVFTFGVAPGAGPLLKGPVLLVVVAGAALLGLWWTATARLQPGRWLVAQGWTHPAGPAGAAAGAGRAACRTGLLKDPAGRRSRACRRQHCPLTFRVLVRAPAA